MSVYFCEQGFARVAMLAKYSVLLVSGLTLHQEGRASFASLQRLL